MALRYSTIRTISTKVVASSGGDAVLWTVNVNTGAGSAVLTVYDGSSTSDTVVAVVDASTKSSHCFGVMCRNGIFVGLAGGNADVTIGYY